MRPSRRHARLQPSAVPDRAFTHGLGGEETLAAPPKADIVAVKNGQGAGLRSPLCCDTVEAQRTTFSGGWAMSAVLDESGGRMVRGPEEFALWHRWDRNFFLIYVGIFWLAVLLGFIPNAIAHERQHQPPYPIAVHVLAAVMVAWLSLLTAQILLIRNKRAGTHRKLGVIGVGLAFAVVVVGPIAAIASDRSRMALPTYHSALLSVQLAGIVSFAGATAAGLVLRAKPAAHKRLMLLGTIGLTDAAFFRWWGASIVKLVGAGGVLARPGQIQSRQRPAGPRHVSIRRDHTQTDPPGDPGRWSVGCGGQSRQRRPLPERLVDIRVGGDHRALKPDRCQARQPLSRPS